MVTAEPTVSTVPTASCPKMRPLVTSGTSPFKNVEIRSADCQGAVHAHNGICAVLDRRLRDILPGFLARSVVHKCFHSVPRFSWSGYLENRYRVISDISAALPASSTSMSAASGDSLGTKVPTNVTLVQC